MLGFELLDDGRLRDPFHGVEVLFDRSTTHSLPGLLAELVWLAVWRLQNILDPEVQWGYHRGGYNPQVQLLGDCMREEGWYNGGQRTRGHTKNGQNLPGPVEGNPRQLLGEAL